MKRLSTILFIIFLLFAGCKEDKIPECHAVDPIEELSWLKELASSTSGCACQITTFQGRYKGHIVFYQLMNDPVCNSVLDQFYLIAMEK